MPGSWRASIDAGQQQVQHSGTPQGRIEDGQSEIAQAIRSGFGEVVESLDGISERIADLGVTVAEAVDELTKQARPE